MRADFCVPLKTELELNLKTGKTALDRGRTDRISLTDDLDLDL